MATKAPGSRVCPQLRSRQRDLVALSCDPLCGPMMTDLRPQHDLVSRLARPSGWPRPRAWRRRGIVRLASAGDRAAARGVPRLGRQPSSRSGADRGRGRLAEEGGVACKLSSVQSMSGAKSAFTPNNSEKFYSTNIAVAIAEFVRSQPSHVDHEIPWRRREIHDLSSRLLVPRANSIVKNSPATGL